MERYYVRRSSLATSGPFVPDPEAVKQLARAKVPTALLRPPAPSWDAWAYVYPVDTHVRDRWDRARTGGTWWLT
jgi:hypothetical protein